MMVLEDGKSYLSSDKSTPNCKNKVSLEHGPILINMWKIASS